MTLTALSLEVPMRFSSAQSAQLVPGSPGFFAELQVHDQASFSKVAVIPGVRDLFRCALGEIAQSILHSFLLKPTALVPPNMPRMWQYGKELDARGPRVGLVAKAELGGLNDMGAELIPFGRVYSHIKQCRMLLRKSRAELRPLGVHSNGMLSSCHRSSTLLWFLYSDSTWTKMRRHGG